MAKSAAAKASSKGKAGKVLKSSTKGKTTKQKATQKISEHMKDMDDQQCFVMTSEGSNLTMQEHIMRDMERNQVPGATVTKFGKTYYDQLRMLYSKADNTFASLAPGAAYDSIVNPKLSEALHLQEIEQSFLSFL